MEDRSNQIQQIEEQIPQGAQEQQPNLLNDRFLFKKQINEGCFGKVYDVTDTQLSERRLIAKMQTSDYQFKREKEFLELFTKKFNEEHKEELEKAQLKGKEFADKVQLKLMTKSDFPLLVSSGEQSMTEWIFVGRYDQFEECQQRAISFDSEFIVKYPKSAKEPKQNNDSKNREVKNKNKGKVYQKVSKLNYCLIMDKFGDSLREIVDLFSNKFTVQTVLQIALQLVTILENIHNLGYVYNDLKPDNILVGDISLIAKLYGKEKAPCKPKEMNLHKLRLIDFGLVTNYLDDNGNHIEDGTEDKFKGSMLFASKYAFNFVCTSRRDDLISLVYNLVFFLDLDRLTFINQVQSKSKQNKFKIIKEAKMAMTPKDLCGSCKEDSPAFCLLDFTEEIFSYGFDTKPDYERLRKFLTKSMNTLGFSPSKNYDWTIKENHDPNEEFISNESGNSELFGNICLDAERASMQALQASIRPNRLLKNQQVIVGTIREEEKSDKNEPMSQQNNGNVPNQQPQQQILNAANAQGNQIPNQQQRNDANMQNNANVSDSVSIDSMKLREMSQNSNINDDIAMDQQKFQQQVNPQIQGIIKNDEQVLVNGSVKCQNQNSTVGQNQHQKASQQASQQNNASTSINNMMNQYLFQTKSNHRFLHDNKGVFLKEMNGQQNPMMINQNMVNNQNMLLNNQLQQNYQQQQYQSASGGFAAHQDPNNLNPNNQIMGQQVQPQLLLQQFNSNCILQQPFNHHQVNNNSYSASIVNQQQRQLQQQQHQQAAHRQAIVHPQPQYAQNSMQNAILQNNNVQKNNIVQVSQNSIQRGQLMQHQQQAANQPPQQNFAPQFQQPSAFHQPQQQQLQQIVGQGTAGMPPVNSARVSSAAPNQQIQQQIPSLDSRSMYHSAHQQQQQQQQQLYYYLQQQQQAQMQQQQNSQGPQAPMQQNFMQQNPHQLQPLQIHQQMQMPQHQQQQQVPMLMQQPPNAAAGQQQPQQPQAYYMPMAAHPQMSSNGRSMNNNQIVEHQPHHQNHQGNANAFIGGSLNPLSVQNNGMSQM